RGGAQARGRAGPGPGPQSGRPALFPDPRHGGSGAAGGGAVPRLQPAGRAHQTLRRGGGRARPLAPRRGGGPHQHRHSRLQRRAPAAARAQRRPSTLQAARDPHSPGARRTGGVNRMSVAETTLDPVSRAFYRRVMHQLEGADVPFLVGGAYAFERYTGIGRHTKDFDIFVHPRDDERALALLAASGCTSEMTFPHWLAKATGRDDVVDLIFSSGNGVALVDALWFRHGVPETVLDVAVKLIPPEEMIWSKAFVMERERY